MLCTLVLLRLQVCQFVGMYLPISVWACQHFTLFSVGRDPWFVRHKLFLLGGRSTLAWPGRLLLSVDQQHERIRQNRWAGPRIVGGSGWRRAEVRRHRI